MGCGVASKPIAAAEIPIFEEKAGINSSKKVELPSGCVKILNPQCSQVRLDHNTEVKTLQINDIDCSLTLKYCYVSQKGYYPNSLGKANQDSYLVCESILGDPNCNLFGIFDGHGEFGDYCSYFSADQLPNYLQQELTHNGGIEALTTHKRNDIYTKAFLETNFALHSDRSIEDSLSGTTGITILQKGNKLYVANVGDSRAIIASEVDGKLKYSPLSQDQTPYRKDERDRLKKAGARIMTMDQLEGNEPMHENYGTDLGEEIDEGGDPPRVWDSSLEKPGCAFSRSLGDAVAKKVGVCAEPEILEWEISPNDKFAVVASDGVFEFITSQNVVDMISKYQDTLEAAKHVVGQAYRLWLTYDDRTDDISIIIISFENLKTFAPSAKKPADLQKLFSISKVMSNDNLLKDQNKPVRKVMSKAKRRDIAEQWDKEKTVDIDFDKLDNNKTQEEIARISKMLNSSFLFDHLSPLQRDHIYKVMKLRDTKANEIVIKEGDLGDEMYVVDSGQFIVYKKDEKGIDQQIFIYSEEGAVFGELSLMYGKPRAASVVAKTNGRLWSIGRSAFRAVMMRGKSEGLLEIYKTIPVLNELTIPALQRLCLFSKQQVFDKDEIVVSSANIKSCTWALCIVITGVLKLSPLSDPSKSELRTELSYLSIFEIGSKYADAKADGKLRIACIPIEIYRDILGTKGDNAFKDIALQNNSKGKRLQLVKSPFVMEENVKLSKFSSFTDYKYDLPVSVIGEFAMIGNYQYIPGGNICSVKMYLKSKTLKLRMDKRVLDERNYLAVLSKVATKELGIPKVNGTSQDSRWAYLILNEHFTTDLTTALHAQSVSDEAKPYYAATLLSAVLKMHDLGIMHRFINPGSCYITKSGVLKLAAFRFAKRMDGSFCFTICGDPLYFAPEIVSQQGYDYAVDLWAFAVFLYEIYEGASPFGTSETDETLVFRSISSYRPSKLSFTSKTPDSCRRLIVDIMQFGPEGRFGYNDPDELRKSEYFKAINWGSMETNPKFPLDILPSVDTSNLQDEPANAGQNTPKHTAFDQF